MENNAAGGSISAVKKVRRQTVAPFL